MKLNSFSFIYILMSRRDIVWQCTYACQQNVKKLRHQICKLWQYGLWSFQTGVTKLERFLAKNQHTQRKLLNFEFWINGELSKSAKIWLSKSIFYVKNHSNLSHFFSLKNTNLGAHFLLLTFFDNINFLFSKMISNSQNSIISSEYVDF